MNREMSLGSHSFSHSSPSLTNHTISVHTKYHEINKSDRSLASRQSGFRDRAPFSTKQRTAGSHTDGSVTSGA